MRGTCQHANSCIFKQSAEEAAWIQMRLCWLHVAPSAASAAIIIIIIIMLFAYLCRSHRSAAWSATAWSWPSSSPSSLDWSEEVITKREWIIQLNLHFHEGKTVSVNLPYESLLTEHRLVAFCLFFRERRAPPLHPHLEISLKYRWGWWECRLFCKIESLTWWCCYMKSQRLAKVISNHHISSLARVKMWLRATKLWYRQEICT